MVATPSENFLKSKAGPLPVWGWGAIGLGVAYAYSRYRQSKNKTQTDQTQQTPTGAAGQPVSGQPTYLIENNIPGSGWSTPVTPVTVTPPITTPPGTTPTPPVNTPTPTPPPSTTPAPPTASASHTTLTYRVMPGDTYTTIAAKYHVPGGAQALYAYNTNPSYNSAYATFQKQGINLLHNGQTIHVPQ